MSGSWAGSEASRVPGSASSLTVMRVCGRANSGGLSFTSSNFTEIQAESMWRGSFQAPGPCRGEGGEEEENEKGKRKRQGERENSEEMDGRERVAKEEKMFEEKG